MRKWFRIALALLLIAALCGVAWWAMSGPPDPKYQGKRLSVWLRGYDIPGMDGTKSLESVMADYAVHNIGTNAIPYLLSMLRAHDAPLKIKSLELLGEQHFINVNYTLAEALNDRASCAFFVLRGTASNAVPELIKIYTQVTNKPNQYFVARSLAAIGPASSNAVPLLLTRIRDPDRNVQLSAIWALGEIHAQHEIVVPELIKLLKDDHEYAAALALTKFGPDASSAIPLLLEIFNTADRSNQNELRDGIMRVDPYAWTKRELNN